MSEKKRVYFKDLVSEVSRTLGLPKSNVEEVLKKALFFIREHVLEEDMEVSIRGFGVFKPKIRERQYPPIYKRIHFTPSKKHGRIPLD